MLSIGASALISFFATLIIIFPFRAQILETSDVLSAIWPSLSYVSLYSHSAWGPKTPGIGIGIFLFLTGLANWTSLYSKILTGRTLSLTLGFLIVIVMIGMLTTGLASRMLFPFFILWCGALFSGIQYCRPGVKSALVAITILAVLSHAVLTVIVENGGMPRTYAGF